MPTVTVIVDVPRERPSGSVVRAVMENIEALAIAIVMALVLKYFLIEAYKIPTGSMQPGIMGDQTVGIYDRVLVNKLVYLLRDPERFEVVVFKNPLWQRQNYIKRAIGFGGERITLRNGDVFVTPPAGGREAIARKRDAVWRAVRKDLTVGANREVDLASTLHVDSGEAKLEGERIVVPAGGEAVIKTREAVRNRYLDGYQPEWVAAYTDPAPGGPGRHWYPHLQGCDVTDVELAADVTPGTDATSIVFQIHESGRIHRAELAIGSGNGTVITTVAEGLDSIEWEDQSQKVTFPALPTGVTTRVSFRNVDDELVLELDDDVVLRRAYRTNGVDADYEPKTRAALVTHAALQAKGSFTLSDVGLWRDIHYLPDGSEDGSRAESFIIPDGEVMVLGDNTQNSWDCRQWEKATYTLKDGRVISGNYFCKGEKGRNPDSNPAVDGAYLEFTNLFGERYRFAEAETAQGDPVIVNVHSVPRDFLLGKALAVFWPLPPFSPSWRLQWVR
ncbi:MAG: signal peptidase I [Planctomycetes bacterium]|nr:signal peptidase I [Planctomycetota bacterium]